MATQRFRSGFDDFMPQTFSTMLDRFFQDSVNQRETSSRFSPLVDSSETENSFVIEMSLPGLTKETIHLDFHQGQLTISGERRFQKEEKRYHLIESHYGTFSRSFYLPDTVDAEKIEAVFENGVLRVTVPKDERKTARHRIEVRDGSSQPYSLDGHEPEEGSQKAQPAPKKKQQASLANENGKH